MIATTVTAPDYEPEAGSATARVLDLFIRNPEEEFTSSDLALKFQVRANQFMSSLAAPMRHGLLVQDRSGGTAAKVWRAGPRLKAWAVARHEAALTVAARGIASPAPCQPLPRPKRQRGGIRMQLPPLDPAQIVTELNAVLPPTVRIGRAGVSKYDVVFANLPVNACRRVPAQYHATLVTAAKKRNKTGAAHYVVRRVSVAETAVFRTA